MAHIDYKWIALSNTTLGILMAALNGSIILIALPAIFRGIGINPLSPKETPYLLWVLMGYLVVTATLLVTCGRISDMFGRVRMYNAGFAVFTLGSILLYFVHGQGNGAAMQLIIYRLIQGVGGAFLFANSTAILVDAFPPRERGMAMGINQIAGIGGGFIGLIVGGLLAEIDWRAVFLVSIPFGVIGTIWAYLMLHETARQRVGQHLDIAGNILFAGGLVAIMIALTYGLEPYGDSSMGWLNPKVDAGIIGGLLMLVAFIFVERRVSEPMFRLDLFQIRQFTMGNLSGFLASLARGGLQFMLIVWLQGIWLPLHGYSFEQTPLWAAIYMIPLTVGFLLLGPISGYLSDRYGARGFATAGMLVATVGFVGLLLLPVNFPYWLFAILVFLTGAGMGLFSAPNTTAIMNSVPAEHRGVSSGMRATFQNVANTLSITVIFSLVTVGLAANLPNALNSGLTKAGIPASAAKAVANLPPTGALFAAFLGYNPLGTLLPSAVLHHLSAATRATVLGKQFFPTLLSGPFGSGLTIAFVVSALCCVGAAVLSLLRGKPVIHEEMTSAVPRPAGGVGTERLAARGGD
jgi:MFS family permease